MKNPVICKACGLVIEEKDLGKVCPACGVPRTAFQPHKDTLSAGRRRALGLHLHPILVHFPQAFTAFAPFMLLLSAFVPHIDDQLMHTARMLYLFLPPAVLASAASGMFDARVRFKKLTTPYVMRKMIAGCLLLVMAIALAAMAIQYENHPGLFWPMIAVSAAALGCQYVLGTIGIRLMFASLPG